MVMNNDNHDNHNSYEAVPSEIIIRKLTRIETVLLGVEGTDAKGLVGDVKYIRTVNESHATRLDEYGEQIAMINARCAERGVCPPEQPVDRRKRFKENVKAGGILVAILGVVTGFIYLVIEIVKRTPTP